MKVFDIVQPTDNWQKNYAYMEYLRIGWLNLWGYQHPIEVNTNPCINHDDPIKAGRCKEMGCYYDLEEPDYD